MTWKPGEPDLQLDLATVVARLEQIKEEGWWEGVGSVVADRVITCDLPRLRRHLTPETLELLDDVLPRDETRFTTGERPV